MNSSFPMKIHAQGMTRSWLVFACVLTALFITNSLHAELTNGPQWWIDRGIIVPGKKADNFAAANIGQLKNMAVQAAAELDARLPGGAGPEINAILDQWSIVEGGVRVPLVTADTNDFAPITIGQLKAVGKPYYDRLAAAGIIRTGLYPWKVNGAHESHAAVANLGQLKNVFSFIAYTPGPNEDSDDDNLPDAWELQNFGNLGYDGFSTVTKDGYTMYIFYVRGLDPQKIVNGVYVP